MTALIIIAIILLLAIWADVYYTWKKVRNYERNCLKPKRIILSAADFEKLVDGKEIEQDGVKIILADIGFESLRSQIIDEIISKIEQLKSLAGKMSMAEWSQKMVKLLEDYKRNELPEK